MTRPTVRFLLGGACVASAGLLAALGLVRLRGWSPEWMLLGWAIPALLTVASGTWLATLHGSRGPGFMVALGSGLLVRMAAVTVGAALAGSSAGAALPAYLAGLVAGYVPAQLYEMVWFYRSGVKNGNVSA